MHVRQEAEEQGHSSVCRLAMAKFRDHILCGRKVVRKWTEIPAYIAGQGTGYYIHDAGHDVDDDSDWVW